MSVIYSTDVIDARLNGVVTALGASATLVLYQGSTVLVSIALTNPAGTVSGGILTFTPPASPTAAAATGTVDSCAFLDSSSNVAISGLTVGIPLSSAEVIIANGFNSLVISAGQFVSLVAAQITGS